MHATLTDLTIEEVSLEQGRDMVRAQVGDRLGISLEAFYDRLDRGEFDDSTDDTVLRLVMMAPFGR